MCSGECYPPGGRFSRFRRIVNFLLYRFFCDLNGMGYFPPASYRLREWSTLFDQVRPLVFMFRTPKRHAKFGTYRFPGAIIY